MMTIWWRSGLDIKPYEVEILAKDGNKKFFEINAQQIMYNNQPSDLIVFRDLSDRKKRDEAEKKLLKKSLFLSRTANELNSFPATKDLYEYIGKTIHEISGNSIVLISIFELELCWTLHFIECSTPWIPAQGIS